MYSLTIEMMSINLSGVTIIWFGQIGFDSGLHGVPEQWFCAFTVFLLEIRTLGIMDILGFKPFNVSYIYYESKHCLHDVLLTCTNQLAIMT